VANNSNNMLTNAKKMKKGDKKTLFYSYDVAQIPTLRKRQWVTQVAVISNYCQLTSTPLRKLSFVAFYDAFQSWVLVTFFLKASFPLLRCQLFIHHNWVLDGLCSAHHQHRWLTYLHISLLQFNWHSIYSLAQLHQKHLEASFNSVGHGIIWHLEPPLGMDLVSGIYQKKQETEKKKKKHKVQNKARHPMGSDIQLTAHDIQTQ